MSHPGYPPPGQAHQHYPLPPNESMKGANNTGPAPFINYQPAPVPLQNVGWRPEPDFSAYLRNVTSFHVKQKVELLEAVVGFETTNKYIVKDNFGNVVFKAKEESDCLSRQCCGNLREFSLSFRDLSGREVLRFNRPFNVNFFCCCVCNDTMDVTTNGTMIGSILEECTYIRPMFSLKNAAGAVVLRIEGPVMVFSCFGTNVNFRLLTLDGTEIGMITKKWSGWARELFTDADYFSVSFPVDLDCSMKAVCLAALFLIDYQYFEGGRGGEGGRRLFG